MKASLFFLLVLFAAFHLHAQIISVKTYPVLSDNSLLQAPSRYHSMGNLSIALRDEEQEAFANPANLMSVSRNSIFLLPRLQKWSYENSWNSPTLVSDRNYIDRKEVSNKDISVGLLQKKSVFAIGAIGSYQSLYGSDNPAVFESINRPVLLSTAFFIPTTSIAIGALYSMVNVHGIDGVGFLYPGSKSVNISGKNQDIRVGLAGSLDNVNEIQLLVGRTTFNVDQTAEYENRFSVDNTVIKNKDEGTNIYTQIHYRWSVSEMMNLGLIALGNWKTLPKISNYPISGIPRDPGTTTAYNFGAGLSWKSENKTLVAFEFIYEPIKSETWVEAERDRNLGGRVIRKGEREQENDYSFRNWIVRTGIEMQSKEWLRLQFGVDIHHFGYGYSNKNYLNLTESNVTVQNAWTEVSLTGGESVSLKNVEVRYSLEILTGRGILEPNIVFRTGALAEGSIGNDFMLIPSGLTVKPVPVYTHLLSLVYYLDFF